jgi:hypothetical protein
MRQSIRAIADSPLGHQPPAPETLPTVRAPISAGDATVIH